jgi:hypothetical protein
VAYFRLRMFTPSEQNSSVDLARERYLHRVESLAIVRFRELVGVIGFWELDDYY